MLVTSCKHNDLNTQAAIIHKINVIIYKFINYYTTVWLSQALVILWFSLL